MNCLSGFDFQKDAVILEEVEYLGVLALQKSNRFGGIKDQGSPVDPNKVLQAT